MAARAFSTYDELLDHLDGADHDTRVLGYAPGGDPVVAVEAGGTAEPAVLVTAGAHATEHAGVAAAVSLVDELETDHRVCVVPCRDPVGLDGYDRALGAALGRPVELASFDDLEDRLAASAEIVFEDGDVAIGLLGDAGFATGRPRDGTPSYIRLLERFKDFPAAAPDVMERLAGRRIYLPAGAPGIEEAGRFGRAFTLVASPDGELLHLNRFFDRAWAPPETRCVRRLFAELEPGLTVDLHESSRQADRYHVSLRPPPSAADADWEERVGRAMVDAVADAGVPLAGDEDIFGALDTVGHGGGEDGDADGDGNGDADGPETEESDPTRLFYTRAFPGAYWVDPNATAPPRRGEGLNCTDFAAEHYGLAFTTELGVYGAFDDRVRAAVESVRAGVDRFADRYR